MTAKMIARVLVLHLLWGGASLAQFDEGPWEHMPREYARSGPWTLVSAIFSNTLHLKMLDATGEWVPVDTLSPPGSRLVSRFTGGVLPVDGVEGKFLVSSIDYRDSVETLWEFSSQDRRFRKVLADRDGFGAVVSGCWGTRVLLSRSHCWFMGREVHATTLLVDMNSGAIVREWKGLDISGAGAPHRYPRYDEKTRAFWIFPAFLSADSPSSPYVPKHLTQLDCVTGDTAVVPEEELFGEDVGEYSVPDLYAGCLLVLAHEEKVGQTGVETWVPRRLLVDVEDRRVLGEWDGSLQAVIEGTERITDDCTGIVYAVRDSAGATRRRLLRIGQTEPVEVDWHGSRGP